MTQAGNRLIVRNRAIGTPAGRLLGVNGHGKTSDIMSIDIHVLKDRKIAKRDHVADGATALQTDYDNLRVSDRFVLARRIGPRSGTFRLGTFRFSELMTMTKRYTFVPPGGGQNYHWSADHTFVKVSAADTGGMYTLMEDNLKAGFQLGLHLHRFHAETFYVLSGPIDFYIDGDWVSADQGACLHVPPGVPHACTVPEGVEAARMLMIYQPSGFDQYLAELSRLGAADFDNTEKMNALNDKFDIVNLGGLPERP